MDVQDHAGVQDCNPCSTIWTLTPKCLLLMVHQCHPTHYHHITCDVYNLAFTRLDIVYVVQQVCLYMHDLRYIYLSVVKQILRYLHDTLDLGLYLIGLY